MDSATPSSRRMTDGGAQHDGMRTAPFPEHVEGNGAVRIRRQRVSVFSSSATWKASSSDCMWFKRGSHSDS